MVTDTTKCRKEEGDRSGGPPRRAKSDPEQTYCIALHIISCLTTIRPTPDGWQMILMARRGLVQGVLQLPCFFPPKAARRICLSRKEAVNISK